MRLLGLPFLWGGADGGAPPIPSISVATPLLCDVQLFPTTSAPVDATGGGGIPTFIARRATDHVVQVTNIRAEISDTTVVPTDIRYVVADATGTLVSATLPDPLSAGVWQFALSRALFTATRGTMTMTITLVAPDATETALSWTLAQGVRQ